MQKWLAVVIVMLLVVAGMFATGCGKSPAEKEGVLPSLEVGDTWVQKVISDGIEYTMTTDIIGEDTTEGRETYVVKLSVEPPFEGLLGALEGKIDKLTLHTLRLQWSGELGVPFIAVSSSTYEPSEATLYPLEVGKELTLTETETSQITALGEKETETETSTYTLKVESIEQVTVPAGTFRTFKVVTYDELGSALETEWKSDAVKLFNVKRIDHESGDISELLSYSLVGAK